MEQRLPRKTAVRKRRGEDGLARFVELHLDELLDRHRFTIGPAATKELRLLQEALRELAPSARVIHLAWARPQRKAA
jgi:hypothetical protein